MDLRRFEKRVENPKPALAGLLVVLSAAYGMLAALNRGLFAAGIRRKRTLNTPVVSVGNITAGGGGKTPLVAWLAQRLAGAGKRTVILSRGYGRSSAGLQVLGGPGWPKAPDAAIHGDEPCLLLEKTGVPVYISSSRYEAAAAALEDGAVDVFILDDGFQHYSLERDLDIVAVDGGRRFGSGRLIPAGILREPVGRLDRADVIVVTKAEQTDPDFTGFIADLTDSPVCWSRYEAVSLKKAGSDESIPLDHIKGKRVFLVSGIADPLSFERLVNGLLVEGTGSAIYPDHHLFTTQDVLEVNRMAKDAGAQLLLTTEKDLVRWPGRESDLPCFALVAEPVFLSGEELLLDRVFSLFAEG